MTKIITMNDLNLAIDSLNKGNLVIFPTETVYGIGANALNYEAVDKIFILSEDEITVLVDMHSGDATACAWGCDLTYDYVKINGDYRT